jgi:ABC-type sugar transport system substrate-binding protein
MVDDDDVVSIELGVTRRKLMKQLGGLGMFGGLTSVTGCLESLQDGTDMSADGTDPEVTGNENESETQIPEFKRVPLTPPPTADQLDIGSSDDPERELKFVVHNATNQFFTPVIAGMNDGLNKLGWSGELVGPTGTDQTEQVEILNTTIDLLQGSRDVLVTTVLDDSSYVSPVRDAIDKGIPVLQTNTTVDAWDHEFMQEEFGQVLPYVGQRAYPAGNAVGITAYEKAQDLLEEDEYTVLPCIATPGHPALQARTDGFVNSIGAQDNVTMLEQLDVSLDVSQATSRIQDAYTANQDINVILGSGWLGPAGAASLVEQQGLHDQMVVGGFDLPESTIKGIQNSTITFTVGQDPYSQGYIPTQLAYEYMDRGIPMKDYITGVSIIDESNIDFVAQRSGSWRDLVDFQKENY